MHHEQCIACLVETHAGMHVALTPQFAANYTVHEYTELNYLPVARPASDYTARLIPLGSSHILW